MIYTPKYILVHHTAANSPHPQFDACNEWHKARNFAPSASGLYVGYHRFIERDGTVRIARQDEERDCDALGHNFDSLSVALAGNCDELDPTDAQIASLGAMLSEWVQKWNISPAAIFPHRHFANKSCYGSRLTDTWAEVVYLKFEIARLSALLAGHNA